MNDSAHVAARIFPTDGETARLCRSLDWASTPLGPIDGWPEGLRTMTAAVLACPLPTMLLWGEDAVQIYNDAYAPFHGGRHPLALGRPNAEVWPEFREANAEILSRVRAGEAISVEEAPYTIEEAPGAPPREVYIDLSYTPVGWEAGSPGGVLVTLIDATARVHERQAQAQVARITRELEHERTRLADVFAQTPALMATSRRPDHVFEMVNAAYQALFPERTLIGRPIREALPELEGQGLIETLDEVFRTGRSYVANGQRVRLRQDATGELVEGLFNIVHQPIRDAAGAVTGILTHGADVTELMRAQERLELAEAATRSEEFRLRAALEELRRSEEKYRVLMEQASEGIFVQDEIDGGFIDVNGTACEMLGYARAELLGLTPSHLLQRDEPEDRSARHDVLRSGRTLLTQRVARRKDGTLFPVELHTKVLPDGRVQTFAKDISERIDREVRMRRAERLASLGTLISGVAHELNNPLHAIQNFAELLVDDEPSAERREDLRTIQREAARMARIVSELRLVVRAEAQAPEKRTGVDLDDVVRHVARTRRTELGVAQIRLDLDLGGSTLVAGDRTQLEQVVLNLLVNAEQAVRAAASDRAIRVSTRSRGGMVELEVGDNGPGILRADLERIFDPFWTSKNPGEGTGLGLSLVQRIVSEHRGEVRVRSRPGEGALFTVTLPAAEAEADDLLAEADVTSDEGEPGTPLHVLIVDDEPANRRVLTRALALRGHTTDEAADGAQALQRLDTTRYDVVISDLRMPGMGGDELLRRLRADRPDVAARVILLTGDPAGAAGLIQGTGTPVLLKPLQLDEAVDVVERHAREAVPTS